MANRDIVTRAGKAAELDATDYDQNVKSHDGTVEEQTGATYTVAYTDQNKTIELNNASMAVTMTAIATIHAAIDTDNFKVILVNTNSADATIARSSTDTFIGGATSLTLKQNEAVLLQTDSTGAIWRTQFYTDVRSGAESVIASDVDFTGTFKLGGTAISRTAAQINAIVGKQTIFIPAAAMQPTVSNGCAALTNVETTASRPDMQVLDFDASSDEHAQFQIAFPKAWDLGTVSFQAFWTTTNAGTTGVAWALQGVAVSDNDTIDVAYGTAVVVTDDNQSAAEDMLVTAESSAITIAGTPADDDMCFFRIFRDVSDANDDMTEDARLIGIKLHFTTDEVNDA